MNTIFISAFSCFCVWIIVYFVYGLTKFSKLVNNHGICINNGIVEVFARENVYFNESEFSMFWFDVYLCSNVIVISLSMPFSLFLFFPKIYLDYSDVEVLSHEKIRFVENLIRFDIKNAKKITEKICEHTCKG